MENVENDEIIIRNDKECTPDLALEFYIKNFARKGKKRASSMEKAEIHEGNDFKSQNEFDIMYKYYIACIDNLYRDYKFPH